MNGVHIRVPWQSYTDARAGGKPDDTAASGRPSTTGRSSTAILTFTSIDFDVLQGVPAARVPRRSGCCSVRDGPEGFGLYVGERKVHNAEANRRRPRAAARQAQGMAQGHEGRQVECRRLDPADARHVGPRRARGEARRVRGRGLDHVPRRVHRHGRLLPPGRDRQRGAAGLQPLPARALGLQRPGPDLYDAVAEPVGPGDVRSRKRSGSSSRARASS